MRYLCILMILAADPSEPAPAKPKMNFARPPEQRQEEETRSPRGRKRPEPTAPTRTSVEGIEPELELAPKAAPPRLESPPTPRQEEAAPPAAKPKMNFARPPKEPEDNAKEPPRRDGAVEVASKQGDDVLAAFFGAPVTGVDYGATITALVGRLNRQTLAGVPPMDELDAFRGVAEVAYGKRKGRDAGTLAERLYANLVKYLELERSFAEKRSSDVLRQVSRLVQEQVALDPNVPDERGDQIVQIIQQNGQFPPASIVFGIQLYPYRAMKVPQGYRVLEMAVTPEYVDEQQRAQASFDLLSPPGPVCRVDFDASRIARLVVEQSHDGKQYREVQAWESLAPGGVQGPVILTKSVKARYIRVVGTGGTDPPMLRNVQLSAYKGPAIASVASAAQAPELDASFKEAAWPRTAEVDGFIRLDGSRFADEPCEVRLCHTRDTLFIGAYIRDRRMSTAVVAASGDDAPIDTDESFEVRVRATSGEPLRFVVNPAGAKLDARASDVSWNGQWTAVAKSYPTGWAVEIAIPYATLNIQPRQGETIQASFVRHRRNVIDEDSAWAVLRGEPAFGTLAFN